LNRKHDLPETREIALPTEPDDPGMVASIRGESHEADAILTPQEAAKYLRISVATLLRWSRSRVIPGFRIGRLWRYRKSALDEWLASQV